VPDLVIRNGTVVDGTGAPRFRADVAVDGARIVAVGRVDERGRRELDATGRVVCPGFLDVHTHSDLMILAEPAHEAKLRQGITTDFVGLDGIGYAPLAPTQQRRFRDYFAALNGDPPVDGPWSTVAGYLATYDRRVAINVAHHVPHGCVRAAVLGWEDRQATPEELQRMQEITHAAFVDGAVALSTGLDYAPCAFATTDELVALSAVAARFTAPYVTHMRYKLGMRAAIRETIEIGRRAGCPVHISHFYSTARGWWPLLDEIDRAARVGVSVTHDSYAYSAGASLLHFFFPDWAMAGGTPEMLRRLEDAGFRQRVYDGMTARSEGADAKPDLARVQLAYVPSEANRALEGQRLDAIARARGVDAQWLIIDLVRAERACVAAVFFNDATDDDFDMLIRHPGHMCSTDAILTGGAPHPRAYGTYPRYLRHFVRERETVPLEAMIRRMTGLPAARFGLVDRGRIAPGLAADVVIFDPATVADRATFDRPKQHPIGIDVILVNGTAVIADGRHTGDLPGRGLRRGELAG